MTAVSTSGSTTAAAPATRRIGSWLGAGGWFGLAILVIMAVVAIAAPVLAPDDPNAAGAAGRLASPSAQHPLGTDLYARDLLSRIIYGDRVSLTVGLIVTVSALVLGLILGLTAAYAGSWVDALIGRVTDTLMAFPGILLAIAILAALGTGIVRVSIALTVVYLPQMIRVVRGTALAVRQRLHVRSATALGASPVRLMVKHIAPFVMGPATVQATFVFAHAILYEASLSFLGLGIQPPQATWGNLVSDGLIQMSTDPQLVIYPSVAITIAVLAVNLLGDALRDRIDPEGRAAGS